MTDIDIEVENADEVRDSLLQLGSYLQSDVTELRRVQPKQMQRLIRISIATKFDDTTGDLARLFTVKPTSYGGIISTENLGKRDTGSFDHAPLALEKGNPPHTITGNPTLKFKPENPGKYRDELVTEDGFVVIDKVEWTPTKQQTATGYEYVDAAQQQWEREVERTIPVKIRNSIRKAGFE